MLNIFLIKLIFIFLGGYLFLYVFWKKLKEDYSEDKILSTGFYTLFGLGLSYLFSLRFASLYWFWITLLGGLIGAFFGILRFKLKPIESLDAVILGFLIIFDMFFLYNFLKSQDFRFGIFFLLIFIIISFYFFLEKRYKNFSWYKSSKVGFSGFTVAGVFFLMRSFISLSLPTLQYMLSFAGKNEVFLSSILSFICFLVVFNLSRVKP